MANQQKRILILVEGARTDPVVMNKLLEVYSIDEEYQIIPYQTNIYTLYREMFEKSDPSEIDLLQLLKERENDPEKRELLSLRYSDILLIFDLDPHDGQFTPDKIRAMADYFVESTDMGKLYLNYPMIEAFYHMKSFPDPDYITRTVTLEELRQHKYKPRVNQDTRTHEYNRYATTQQEYTYIICENIRKSWQIIGKQSEKLPPDLRLVLDAQLAMIEDEKQLYVLCTCVFFIADYNPNLLGTEDSIV